jgi:hypothetical protein
MVSEERVLTVESSYMYPLMLFSYFSMLTERRCSPPEEWRGMWIALVQSIPRIFIFPLTFFTERRCSFPEEWRGKWYQNGLGSVNLTQHTMTKKGTCHITRDNKYVVYNK